MIAIRKKMFVGVFAVALFAFGATAASALADTDTWVPPAWAAKSSSTTFSDPSTGLAVTCTTNTASGNSIGTGPDIGALAMKAPTFKNCTDSLGGADTVKPKSSGWTISFISDIGNAKCPSGTGTDDGGGSDCVVIGVPQNAAVINVGGLPGCTLTVQPGGATSVGATVSDPGGKTKDTFTLSGGPEDQLSYSATPSTCLGITGGTAFFSGTYTLSAPNSGVLVDTP
jgi:hypothetical protein